MKFVENLCGVYLHRFWTEAKLHKKKEVTEGNAQELRKKKEGTEGSAPRGVKGDEEDNGD